MAGARATRLLAASLLLSKSALAQEPPEPPVDAEPPAMIDVIEETISEQIRATAAQLDAFFGDPRHLDETNETELRLGLGLAVEDRRGVDVLGRVRGRLNLPLLERRVALVIGRAEDERLPGERVDEVLDDDRLRDGAIGLRFALRQVERESLSLTTGLRFSSGTPQVFAGPRYRRTWLLDRWAVGPTLIGRWFSKDGFASSADLDFETALGPFMLLRLTPGLDWTEKDPGIGYGFGAHLFQGLGQQRIISYFATVGFRTKRPSGLDVAALGIRYRQSVLRHWIFVEVEPAVLFRDENDHDPTARLTARIELVFGGPPRPVD